MDTNAIVGEMRAKAKTCGQQDNVSLVQYPATKDEGVITGPLGTGEYCVISLPAATVLSMSEDELRAEVESAMEY